MIIQLHREKLLFLAAMIALAPFAKGQSLAQIMASDGGGVAANYEAHAASLAKTLNLLTTAQLAEVFDGKNPPAGEVTGGNPPPSPPPAGYEDALDTLIGAQAGLAAAAQDLTDAQSALDSVLADDAGLKSDGIPFNYGIALNAAQTALAAAQTAYDAAEQVLNAAQQAVDAFGYDPDSNK